jgi:precorrin-6x reductase
MYKLLIFGGTTEGRKLIEYLKDKNIKIYLCVATEYGESLIEENENIKISSKRLNKEDMIELINKENFDLVIDSTHPYALEVSENIFLACKETKKEYLRLLRESEEERRYYICKFSKGSSRFFRKYLWKYISYNRK